MKLSRLKQIIAEQLRQLKEQKSLITEGCKPMESTWQMTCQCTGTGQGGSCTGTATMNILVNCNHVTTVDCSCCIGMVDPRGGSKEPMGTSIG